MMTLGDAGHELATRLGFATMGGAALQQQGILRSFIRSAQHFLYWNMADERFVRVGVFNLAGLGQSLFDLPENMEAGKRFEVRWRKDDTALWKRLERTAAFADVRENAGTPYVQSRDVGVAGEPVAYRLVGQQIEITPATEDRFGQLRLDYVLALPELQADSDTLMLDGEAVLLLALANAKAHYQHPDAGQYATLFDRLTKQARAAAHVDKFYKAGG